MMMSQASQALLWLLLLFVTHPFSVQLRRRHRLLVPNLPHLSVEHRPSAVLDPLFSLPHQMLALMTAGFLVTSHRRVVLGRLSTAGLRHLATPRPSSASPRPLVDLSRLLTPTSAKPSTTSWLLAAVVWLVDRADSDCRWSTPRPRRRRHKRRGDSLRPKSAQRDMLTRCCWTSNVESLCDLLLPTTDLHHLFTEHDQNCRV